MSIYAIYFSPTGGTEKIVTFIAEQFGEYQSIDLCEKTSDLTNDFSEEDLCIIGVPSFGGRVPAIALERIKALNGNSPARQLLRLSQNIPSCISLQPEGLIRMILQCSLTLYGKSRKKIIIP